MAIGGGHGTAVTLKAARRYAGALTGVVSVADDGGSSGRLRELLNVVALGDIRKCLVALADEDAVLARAFEHRFDEGELAGHALGNLILAGLVDATGDLVLGVAEAAQLLGARAGVLPATTEQVVLKAEADHGEVAGQVAVKGTADIQRVSLVPGDAQPPPLATERIAEADQIVIGPGSLFTSVLAAVAVRGIAEAVASSAGQVVYVCNLHPQIPETEGYDVAAHVAALARHGVAVDVVLCDSIPGMGIGDDGCHGAGRPPDGCEQPGAQPGQTGAGAVRSAGIARDPRGRDEMTVRVGINGFGRIGRNFLRADPGHAAPTSRWSGVNDLTSPETQAHLLRYDSTQGRLPVPVDVEGSDLVVGERHIRVLAEREPAQLPWADLGVEVVVESTGIFTSREAAAGHLGGSVQRVIISAPSGDADATFVIGVNDHDYDPEHAHRRLERLVHHQLLRPHGQGDRRRLRHRERAHDDGARLHQRPEPARPAAQGPAPGAGRGHQHRADLDRGGPGHRPGPGGHEGAPRRLLAAGAGAGGLHHRLHRRGRGNPSVADVNAAFAEAAAKPPLDRVLEYTEDPIVSSDIVGSPASCTFDAGLTMVMPIDDELSLVKIYGWYDNEWGYSNRLVDLTVLVGG